MNGAGALPAAAVDFRAAWGRLVGVLVRTHRLADPSLAEDAVQHAMLQATRLWPVGGPPQSPLAWLTTVARNHLRDALRARAVEASLDVDAVDVVDIVEAAAADAGWGDDTATATGELGDDELALLFACCDPALPVASQVALALKTVCGFSLREIAAGLLSDEAAIAQRLARARRTLAARAEPIGLPAGPALPERRDAALLAIHLLFNEGYAATAGDDAQRPDLCREAIRLARAVAAHPATAHAEADALAALLLFQGAWLGQRVDAQGDWRLLDEHDRAHWDPSMIAAGFAHLQRAQRADALSVWHLRAGIASEHASAPGVTQTRWQAIAAAYDTLVRLDPAPATRLAQAVAVSFAHGPAAGLALIDRLQAALPAALRAHAHAARADMSSRLGRHAEARTALDQAIALAPTPVARRLMQRKRARLG